MFKWWKKRWTRWQGTSTMSLFNVVLQEENLLIIDLINKTRPQILPIPTPSLIPMPLLATLAPTIMTLIPSPSHPSLLMITAYSSNSSEHAEVGRVKIWFHQQLRKKKKKRRRRRRKCCCFVIMTTNWSNGMQHANTSLQMHHKWNKATQLMECITPLLRLLSMSPLIISSINMVWFHNFINWIHPQSSIQILNCSTKIWSRTRSVVDKIEELGD